MAPFSATLAGCHSCCFLHFWNRSVQPMFMGASVNSQHWVIFPCCSRCSVCVLLWLSTGKAIWLVKSDYYTQTFFCITRPMWTWCEYTECMKKAVTNFCWLWLYAVAWYVALRYRTDFQVRSREREITSRWLNKKHWYYSKTGYNCIGMHSKKRR